MSKLDKRLKELEEKVEKIEVVGEVYVQYPSYYFSTGIGIGYYWSKFREKDITDRIDGYIKVHRAWYPSDEVVFYRDENRIQNLKKKVQKSKEAKDETSKNS